MICSGRPIRLLTWMTMLSIVAVAGCNGGAGPEEVHTVSWYMAHKDERVAKVRWCADDAARGRAANCQNAAEADQKAMMTPNVKSSADDLKFK
jgi:hypothetical protein